ncbi:MAG: biotin synthase BioB [Pseudanabaenaceae cyanobacterium SKYGB_i_bin29]|nr:biotin synthase BioB [Pseudanabaenaceae cyanobacterium SKYG29]MDW8421338.1 biotin synthase BioB [Pseudanabaenaceae cyanobacterium SKYGB_i_bin29]
MLSLETVQEIYHRPLLSLIFTAQAVHRQYHPADRVQLCTLANIKSGNCPEDCKYCPQSRRYTTGIAVYPLLSVAEVLRQAEVAKANGSTRFCMGAAWRQVPEGQEFAAILEMVRGVRALGLEACMTLGMVKPHQAQALAQAGLTAYNHNLDTSATFYPEIITTRAYSDRLETIKHIAAAGIEVCCGGIIGMGESHEDRIMLLHTLANLQPPPQSVPINALVPIPGTPLGDRPPVSALELARVIATARLLMPQAMIRLSAGRKQMSVSDQALCFLAGANSIFTGEKLLTTPNPGTDSDRDLLAQLGLTPLC